MNYEDLIRLLTGKLMPIFNGNGAIQIINGKFAAFKLNSEIGEYETLNTYCSLETAIKRILRELDS